ncbi:hypothetical protein HGA91_02100 [candidate division WWE3 bacterium]|nr:hypothetical protein [candidate division WWE3 bacterium]
MADLTQRSGSEDRMYGFIREWRREARRLVVYSGEPINQSYPPQPQDDAVRFQASVDDLAPSVIGLILCRQAAGQRVSFIVERDALSHRSISDVHASIRLPRNLQAYTPEPSRASNQPMIITQVRDDQNRTDDGGYRIMHSGSRTGGMQVLYHASSAGVLAAFDTFVPEGNFGRIPPVLVVSDTNRTGYLLVPIQSRYHMQLPRTDFYPGFWREAAQSLGLDKITLVICRTVPAYVLSVRSLTEQFSFAETRILVDGRGRVWGQLQKDGKAWWDEAPVLGLDPASFPTEPRQILTEAQGTSVEANRRLLEIQFVVSLLAADGILGRVYTPIRTYGKPVLPVSPSAALVHRAIENMPFGFRPQLRTISVAS